MTLIKTYPMSSPAILRLYADKGLIDVEPEYQRRGEIWDLYKKQLLIDSVLNDYDIPKIYLHKLSKKTKRRPEFEYAIIDGRQRMEAIWGFMQLEFNTADTFKYFKNSNLDLSNLSYKDLGQEHPLIKTYFDSFTLPIIIVETEDLDMIEDMFSRLNEAVPLNAAERRNAIGGFIAEKIRKVSQLSFFKNNVRITDKRYQHREIAARLLFLEYSISNMQRIIDTKRMYLDEFVSDNRNNRRLSNTLFACVKEILDVMSSIFDDNDVLLRAQANIPIYYLVLKSLINRGCPQKLSREAIETFNEEVIENRRLAEQNISSAKFELLEFARRTQQGTNDAISIKFRVNTLLKYLNEPSDYHFD